MNIFEHILGQINDLLSLYTKDSLKKVTAEPPRDLSHGDVSTNAAMVLAKEAKKSPQQLAQDFSILFKQIDCVAEISIAGPGFINFKLKIMNLHQYN
jgi:arginyl-tRNA synthetase